MLALAAPRYDERVSVNAGDFEWHLLALAILSAELKTVILDEVGK